jgi:hypothetical protein
MGAAVHPNLAPQPLEGAGWERGNRSSGVFVLMMYANNPH